jgi:hypothetical protein
MDLLITEEGEGFFTGPGGQGLDVGEIVAQVPLQHPEHIFFVVDYQYFFH